MARGRFLSKSVSTSETLHALPDDTCRLLATWLIPHLDKNGVLFGEAVLIRSTVFPWRSSVSIKRIERYIDSMCESGYAAAFYHGGRRWLWFPAFVNEQQGLRPERESTRRPLPPEEVLRPAGYDPDLFRQRAGQVRAGGGDPSAQDQVQDQVQDQGQDQVQQQEQGQSDNGAGDGDGHLPEIILSGDELDSYATLLDIGVTEERAAELAQANKASRVRAWCIYATKKPGIRDPAAYAISQLRSKARPPPEAYQWAAEMWG